MRVALATFGVEEFAVLRAACLDAGHVPVAYVYCRSMKPNTDTDAHAAATAGQVVEALADLGYIGLHPDIITGYKRKRGEKSLPEAKKAANRVQAGLRCLGERANAQLKYWRVLTCDFRGTPRRLTTVVKAVQTLHYWIRDPFGTSNIDAVS